MVSGLSRWVSSQDSSEHLWDFLFIDIIVAHFINQSINENFVNSSLHFWDLSVVWEEFKAVSLTSVPDIHVFLIQVGEEIGEEDSVSWLDVTWELDFEDPLHLKTAARKFDSLGHGSFVVSLWVLDADLVESSVLLISAGGKQSQILLTALVDKVVELVEKVDLIDVGVSSHVEAWAEDSAEWLVLISEDVSSDILVEVGDWVGISEVLLSLSAELVLAEWSAGQTGINVVDLIHDLVSDLRDTVTAQIHLIDLGSLEEDIESTRGSLSSDVDDWSNSGSVSLHLNPIDLDWSTHLVEGTNGEFLLLGVEAVLFRDTPTQSSLDVLNFNHILVVLELLGLWNILGAV